ncbi:hypothetical protein ACOSQ4_001710 [Xanthoceras sorbifolium]
MQNHHIFAVLILVLLFPAGESCHHEISLPNCQMEKCLEICQTQCGPNEVGRMKSMEFKILIDDLLHTCAHSLAHACNKFNSQEKARGTTEASRPLGVFHPPAIPTSPLSMNKPKPPSMYYYTINRYKKTESEAFRPTSPGHSPGVGNKEPPPAP